MNPGVTAVADVGTTQSGHPTRPDEQQHVRLMGMRIDVVTGQQAVDRIVGTEGGVSVTPNLDHLRQFCTDAKVASFYEAAELVSVDGMPLLWASRIMGSPLPERIAGSNMIWSVSEAAASCGVPVFLLGGNPGAAEAAAGVLSQRFPGLQVAGTACPPFGFECDPAQIDAIADEVQASGALIVFVGLPLEKMMPLIGPLRTRLPNAWYLEVGVSFSFVSGEIARAPVWMQRLGIEWLHRLGQEPRRLARRYLVEGMPFAAYLFASALRVRLGRQASLKSMPAPAGVGGGSSVWTRTTRFGRSPRGDPSRREAPEPPITTDGPETKIWNRRPRGPVQSPPGRVAAQPSGDGRPLVGYHAQAPSGAAALNGLGGDGNQIA